MEKFFPRMRVERIQDIDFNMLLKNNIKGLILDIDNTLVPYHMEEADEKAVSWIERAKAAGLKACIVSNNTETRVIKFNENLKINAIHRAMKPAGRSFTKAARLMELEPGEVAVVGDQIFTDIYGGNRAGMFTILVNPIDKNEQIFIKIKRVAEKFVLHRYKRKTGIR